MDPALHLGKMEGAGAGTYPPLEGEGRERSERGGVAAPRFERSRFTLPGPSVRPSAHQAVADSAIPPPSVLSHAAPQAFARSRTRRM